MIDMHARVNQFNVNHNKSRDIIQNVAYLFLDRNQAALVIYELDRFQFAMRVKAFDQFKAAETSDELKEVWDFVENNLGGLGPERPFLV